MAIKFVPAHINETTEPVDNVGGVMTVVLVGSLIVGINFLPVANERDVAVVLLVVAAVAAVLFVVRERRTAVPLYDLKIAARPTFWVAGCAGIIVFGSLMGAAYISQQFLQNVLSYSTLEAGAAIIPAGIAMVLVAPRSAKLVQVKGSRLTLLMGQALVFLAFLAMFLFWREDISYWVVAIPYVLLGVGVGLSGTPSSNSLTGSVPVTRVGMASGTADLQRDLGGALMTSVFGALLTAGYASAMGVGAAGHERHREHPGPAPAVLRERGGPRRQQPGPGRADHGGRAVVVPRRRPVGVRRRDGRGADRHGDRLPLLPAPRAGGGAARLLPGRRRGRPPRRHGAGGGDAGRAADRLTARRAGGVVRRGRGASARRARG